MKNLKALLFILCYLLVFPVNAVQLKNQNQQQELAQKVTLDMQNMTCALCKITIKKALQAVDGVQKVNVDFDSKTAEVVFDPQKTNTNVLIKATTDVGYPASIHQEK